MGIFKDAFIERHGAEAYAEKLAKNAKYQAENAEVLAEKRRKITNAKSEHVLILGDVHIGSRTTDVDEIKSLSKKYWRGYPIILNGDLIDAGIDRGMQFNNSYDPQDSLNIVKEIFKPLQIIGYNLGNHELRVFKTAGINVYRHIFDMEEATTIIQNGREIYFSHGKSAAENMFLEFQKIVKWCDSDILCLGHSHDLARITFLRGKKLQTLVRTGSFIKRERYAIAANYAPKVRGWCDYNTRTNFVHLKAISNDTGEIFEI